MFDLRLKRGSVDNGDETSTSVRYQGLRDEHDDNQVRFGSTAETSTTTSSGAATVVGLFDIVPLSYTSFFQIHLRSMKRSKCSALACFKLNYRCSPVSHGYDNYVTIQFHIYFSDGRCNGNDNIVYIIAGASMRLVDQQCRTGDDYDGCLFWYDAVGHYVGTNVR